MNKEIIRIILDPTKTPEEKELLIQRFEAQERLRMSRGV